MGYSKTFFLLTVVSQLLVSDTSGYYDIDDTLWHKIDFQPLVGKAEPTVEDSQVKGGKGNKIGGKNHFYKPLIFLQLHLKMH